MMPAVQPSFALLLVLLAGSFLTGSCRNPGWAGGAVQPVREDASNASVAYVANMSDPAAADIKVPVVSFRDALENPKVSTIVLLTKYTAGNEFDGHVGDSPSLKLTRNVTVTAQPWLMPVLDFKFMRSVLHLCEACTFEIRDAAIANERRGNGASVDFFVGEPGSVLLLRNAYRLRLACTSTDSTLELIKRDQKRSSRFPVLDASGGQQQVLKRQNLAFQGHAYVDMIWLVDYSYDVPQAFQEGKGLVGGFNMRTINTTRLCYTTINASCLQVKGPDACVNDAIDQLLALEEGQAGQQQVAPGPQGNPWLVAVVVPVSVVAGLLVVSTLVLWVLCSRHRRRQQMQKQLYDQQPRASEDTSGSKQHPMRGSASTNSRERALLDPDGGVDSFLDGDVGPARLDQGWEVVAMNTSPSLGTIGSCKIHFGHMLGSGSFGRVYKGRWAGREVAIKCIEHDSDTSTAVENEVQLMLSCDHDNIVKAYHYITYRHTLNITSGSESPMSNEVLRRDSSDAALRRTSSDAARQSTQPSPAALGSPATKQQQREQQKQLKQLKQLQHQLQKELGPQHRWLLDMHLGFAGKEGAAGSAGSSASSSTSRFGSLAQLAHQGSSSSAAVTSSLLSPAAAACASSSADLSSGLVVDAGCSTALPQTSTNQGAGSSSSSSSVHPVLPLLQSQQQQQVVQPLPALLSQPQQQQQEPQLVFDADCQQAQVHEEQQHQQLQPGMPADVEACGMTTRERAGSLHSSPEHPESGHGSISSRTSTGQALTPNQKMQLQRYLQRQQHLLQSSGMRIRSSSAVSPQLSNHNDNGDNDGANPSDNRGSERTPRRPHELARSRTYIVQEFCNLGTFTSYASKTLSDPTDDEQMMQLLVLLQDAARGIAALHSKSVVHGDVNARNVLVCSSSTAPYGAVAKLADLGLSRIMRQQATHKTTNTVGTLSHMPPELLRKGILSAAVDIYSFGIMMWEVFTAQPAFRSLHYGQFFECIVMKNMRPNVPEDMPRDFSLLMLSCWATNPADRPTADRLLEVLQLMLQERREMMAEQLMYPPSAASSAMLRGARYGANGCGTYLAPGLGQAGEGLERGLGFDGGSSSDGSSLHLQG